jgi:hypothetical protein
MANRLYIVPRIGTGTHDDPYRAKYFGDGTVPERYSATYYGFEPLAFVVADLSAADQATITAFTDARILPTDLSQNLTGAQVTATSSYLEGVGIPAGWITTSLTWTQVLRVILGIFSFMQRMSVLYSDANGGAHVSIFGGGATLDSTFGSLPTAVRTAMIAAAQDQGISTAGLQAGTTIRVILKALGDNYVTRPVVVGGLTI